MVPKVSVLVPVYNTEKYIRKCLDSLCSQTLRDIEIILIDDGSTDCSGDICNEYAEKDNRFVVIHQKNGGSSAARQTGMDVACGEFVIVCDSDDWVEQNMYETLYNHAIRTGADIVMCSFSIEYEEKSVTYIMQDLCQKSEQEIINEIMVSSLYNSSWTKLVKRELFTRYHISYVQGINMGEDCLILFKLLKTNPIIRQINLPLYHYRRLCGSLSYTNTLNMSSIHQMYFIYEWIKKNYDNHTYSEGIATKAVDITFALLRVQEIDETFFKTFLQKDMTWKTLKKARFNLKLICVGLSMVFPTSVVRYLVKHLYPILYR